MPLDAIPVMTFEEINARREFIGLPTYSCEPEMFAALVLPTPRDGDFWLARTSPVEGPIKTKWAIAGDWSRLDKFELGFSRCGLTGFFGTAPIIDNQAGEKEEIDADTGEVTIKRYRTNADLYVRAKRCLHIDIDVGKDGYVQTQAEAWELLQGFCKTLGIPLPTFVVNRGGLTKLNRALSRISA